MVEVVVMAMEEKVGRGGGESIINKSETSNFRQYDHGQIPGAAVK